MRINVRFENQYSVSGEYCYLAPDGTRVGDVVLVPPTPYSTGPKLARVTSIPRDGYGYMGRMKHVQEVYHKAPGSTWTKSGPDYGKMLKDLEEASNHILEQVHFIKSRIN